MSGRILWMPFACVSLVPSGAMTEACYVRRHLVRFCCVRLTHLQKKGILSYI